MALRDSLHLTFDAGFRFNARVAAVPIFCNQAIHARISNSPDFRTKRLASRVNRHNHFPDCRKLCKKRGVLATSKSLEFASAERTTAQRSPRRSGVLAEEPFCNASPSSTNLCLELGTILQDVVAVGDKYPWANSSSGGVAVCRDKLLHSLCSA